MNEDKVVMKNRAQGIKDRCGNMKKKKKREIEKVKMVMTLPSLGLFCDIVARMKDLYWG